MQALGFVETKGLVAAIEGADTMLKTSNVRLVSKTLVKSGIVTITITGDIAACKTAVEAAETAIEKMGGTLLSTHVIPRPHESLEGIMIDPENLCAENREVSDGEIIEGESCLKNSQSVGSQAENGQLIHEESKINFLHDKMLYRKYVEELIGKDGTEKAFVRLNRARACEIKGLICNEYSELELNENMVETFSKKELIKKLKDFYEKKDSDLSDSEKVYKV